MSNLPEISIIVPIYNESTGLEELIRRLNALRARMSDSIELVLVDDGSTDGSREILSDPDFLGPGVRVIFLLLIYQL